MARLQLVNNSVKSLEVTALRWLDEVFKLPDYQFNYQTGRNTLGQEFLKITMFKALPTKKNVEPKFMKRLNSGSAKFA